jgi:PilZ domain
MDESSEAQLYQTLARVMACNNRRHQPRRVQAAEIRIRQISGETPSLIFANVQNLSRGGICIASRVPLLRSSVVKCEIGIPEMTFAIPALMQVVWVEETCPWEYEVGLRYLF